MPKGEEASGVPCWAGVRNSKPHFEFMVLVPSIEVAHASACLGQKQRKIALAQGRLCSRWRTGCLRFAREAFLSASAEQPVERPSGLFPLRRASLRVIAIDGWREFRPVGKKKRRGAPGGGFALRAGLSNPPVLMPIRSI
jgi:hypothetical protein